MRISANILRMGETPPSFASLNSPPLKGEVYGMFTPPSKGRYMVWYSDTFSLGTARELPCRAKYVKCRREETSRRPHITISPYYTLFYYRPHSTAAYRYDCFTACWHHCLQAYIVIKIGGKFARRTVALGEPAFGIDKIAYAVHHAFVFARNIEIDVAI